MIPVTAEYALRAVVFLIQNQDEFHAASAMSERIRVPASYLVKVLQQLTRAGIVRSQRGPGGGYTLVKSADQITIHDVFEAVDSVPDRIKSCPLGLKGHTELCVLHRMVDNALLQMEIAFRTTSLRQLLDTADEMVPLCDL